MGRARWCCKFAISFIPILLIAPYLHAQSELQRCLSLPANARPAMAEYCQGIRAAEQEQNQSEAFQHYLRSAQMGYSVAQAVVGAAYRMGWTVPVNLQQAVYWYQKAAAQGSDAAELDLGLMYANGMGVPKDPGKARQLMQEAARQGNRTAEKDLASLGGTGMKAAPGAELWNQATARYQSGDHAGAARLILQAAQAGNPTATYEMGYLYENGDGVQKNMAEAARWYAKGASMGECRSEAAIGSFYEAGNQVPDNWITAAQWYQKSAAQSCKAGESRLGRAYEYGIGVPIDLGEATGWYDKAASQGDSQAAYFAKYLRDNHGIDGSSYDDREKAIKAPNLGMPGPGMTFQVPAGTVFRNTADRLSYIQAWENSIVAYNQCVAAHYNVPAGTIFRCPAAGPPRR
jgi:TPR repeat protein